MQLWSSADVAIANELMGWFREFLVKPNPMMRRSTASTGESVCPFAAACLEDQTLYFAFHHEVNGKSAEAIERIVLDYREPFRRALPYQEKERITKALLIVFPDIDARNANALDIAHESTKRECVDHGLMITQCYPLSEGRSVHNQALKVYTSPYPLMAMRHMALHDILFVQEDHGWFAAYDQRFGARFREPEKLTDYERPLVSVYRQTKARFVR
jgi:heptaprenyl diphosphate synthase